MIDKEANKRSLEAKEIAMSELEITEPEMIPHHTEFETKYRVDGSVVHSFKKLVEGLEEKYNFIYVQGPDYYFTKNDAPSIFDCSFLRYRKADGEKRAEVTMKKKPEGAKHNIQRKEVNWRVDATPYETIHEGAIMQGYDYNFKVRKVCHIYKFKEVTLVFYTVENEKEKLDHFIEIELDEATIHTLTKDQAWDRIRKYETVLAPLGITHRNRLTKSLYEMYVKDIYSDEKSESVV